MTSEQELNQFIETLCRDLGLNTAHDYDGVETQQDREIYKKAIRTKIAKLNTKNNDNSKSQI